MENEPRDPRPTWRRGWLYTLFKCSLLMASLAAVGAGALWWLLHRVSPPWFIPRPVFEWLVDTLAPYAAWIGGALGAFVGFLGSLGVVVYDARKGRLSKVR